MHDQHIERRHYPRLPQLESHGERRRKYNHVNLPSSISVGDVFRVRYGSNPKGYEFHVGRINTDNGVCSIYPFGGGRNVRDRITATCQSCSNPRSN